MIYISFGCRNYQTSRLRTDPSNQFSLCQLQLATFPDEWDMPKVMTGQWHDFTVYNLPQPVAQWRMQPVWSCLSMTSLVTFALSHQVTLKMSKLTKTMTTKRNMTKKVTQRCLTLTTTSLFVPFAEKLCAVGRVWRFSLGAGEEDVWADSICQCWRLKHHCACEQKQLWNCQQCFGKIPALFHVHLPQIWSLGEERKSYLSPWMCGGQDLRAFPDPQNHYTGFRDTDGNAKAVDSDKWQILMNDR